MSTRELCREDLIKIRKKCDKDLLFFTRFWFKTLHGTKFIVAEHHKEITQELKRIENYELSLLNINIPPRFSKTELALNFIARSIGQNPTSNWLYITASDELRAQTSVSIRDIVTHPYFKIMYGVELKKDQNGKNLWRTKQGGGLKTATIGGQITGFGAGQMVEHDNELEDYVRSFEGAIVLDDINKIDDAEQKNANNDKVNRIIFNTIFSRKNSKDTPIINIQQRAGTDDATAALMEHFGEYNPKAKFLIMPVIKDGVPLWEWKHDLEDIERLRTSEKTRDTFNTQYMQEPVNPKGLLMPIKELTFLNTLPKDDYVGAISISDPADAGGDNLAVLNIKLYYDGKRLRGLIDTVTYTDKGVEITLPRITSQIVENKSEQFWIETNGVGKALFYLSKIVLLENEYNYELKGYHQKMPKEVKINSFYEFAKRLFVFREDYKECEHYKRYITHLTNYQAEKPKKHTIDAMDLTCWGGQIIKAKYQQFL